MEDDAVAGGQARDEIVELEDEADVAAPVDGEIAFAAGRQVPVAETKDARGGAIKTAHDVQQFRLAAA